MKIIVLLQEQEISPQTSSANLSLLNASEATVVAQGNGAARRTDFVQPAGGNTRGADFLRQLFHSPHSRQSGQAQSLASTSQVGAGSSEGAGALGSAGAGATQNTAAAAAVAASASVQE